MADVPNVLDEREDYFQNSTVLDRRRIYYPLEKASKMHEQIMKKKLQSVIRTGIMHNKKKKKFLQNCGQKIH